MFLYAEALLLRIETRLEVTQELAGEGDTSGAKRPRSETELLWKSKVRRLREELEEAAIWRVEVLDDRDSAQNRTSDLSHPLDTGGAFALRYTQFYDPLIEANSQLSAFSREVVDIIKRNAVDMVHVQRLHAHITGYCLFLPTELSDVIFLLTTRFYYG